MRGALIPRKCKGDTFLITTMREEGNHLRGQWQIPLHLKESGMKMSSGTKGCKKKNIPSLLEEAQKILTQGALFRGGILRIVISENMDTHQKELKTWREMKKESLPGTQSGSPSILSHITKRRRISGTLDPKLTAMLRGNTQMPVQQPKYPMTITTGTISSQMITRILLMGELRNT